MPKKIKSHPPLSSQSREEARRRFSKGQSRTNTPCSLDKTELQDTINAADDWYMSSADSYEAALPPKAQAELTDKQKAEIRAVVGERRYEELA